MKTYTRISILVVSLSILFFVAPLVKCDDKKIYTATHGYMTSLFTNVSGKDAQIAMDLWLDEVYKVRNNPITTKAKTVIFNDLPSIIAALKNKQVDFIGITSLNYYKIKDITPIDPFITYTQLGQRGTVYYLMVPKDKGEISWSGLKNMRLLIQKYDDKGQIPLLWLNSCLRKQGLPPAETFFRSIKIVETPSQAILPVFFKQADC
jgi:hypothetical protein